MRRVALASLVLLFSFAFSPPAAANVISVVDSAGDVGHSTSIAAGSDGNPVIVYLANSQTQVRLAHCLDPTCSSATINAISAGSYETSVTIGPTGFPLVGIYSGGSLKFARCTDLDCTPGGTTVTTVDSGSVGRFSEIVVPAGGNPVIIYWDNGADDLLLAACNDAACTSATLRFLDGTGVGAGRHSSMVLGSDGNPVISYYHDYSDLKVLHCDDPTCATWTTNIVDGPDQVGSGTSIAIAADGNPIIAYHDTTNTSLKVAHCTDLVCSGATITTVDNTADVGNMPSIGMGAGGLAVISHGDYTSYPVSTALRLTRCSNTSCTAATHEVLDTGGVVGEFDALAISGGHPVVSYWDRDNSNLKMVWVASVLPVPGAGRFALVLIAFALLILLTEALNRRKGKIGTRA